MSTIVVPVYPSQLDAFKEKADRLADKLKQSINIKVSKFKRYEYLARGIGHVKGHDRLIENAKRIAQADKLEPLMLFSDPVICNQIGTVFKFNYSQDIAREVQEICKDLGTHEAIMSNTTSHLLLSDDMSFYATEEYKKLHQQATGGYGVNENVNIDRSEAPTDMNPYRKLLVLGLNELIDQEKISLDYKSTQDNSSGHVKATIAGHDSIIIWNDVGHGELRFNVWWKYVHSKHPQANLTGSNREDFNGDMPLSNPKNYKNFVGVTCGAWLERQQGCHIQGKGNTHILGKYTRKGELALLKALPNPKANGYEIEGRFYF